MVSEIDAKFVLETESPLTTNTIHAIKKFYDYHRKAGYIKEDAIGRTILYWGIDAMYHPKPATVRRTVVTPG